MATKGTGKPLFEHTSCSRCGGSGRFSYCQMYGDRCFKCGGSGYQLTKRGREAQDYLVELRKVRLDELQIGDQVWIEPTMFSKGGWARVDRISTTESGSIQIDNHLCGLEAGPDHRVRLRRSNQEAKHLRAIALCYQTFLAKTGALPKRPIRGAAA